MSNESVNYWKLATIGILLVGATVAATLMVAGPDSKTEESGTPSSTAQSGDIPGAEHEKNTASTSAIEETPAERPRSVRATQPNRSASAAVPPPPQAAYPPKSAYPSQSVMDACNRYANEQVNSKAQEVLTSAALGAAIGAAVGAAGGAIAGGGKGAGKGAAIGGVTGAAGGTLYGLNETKSHDAQYQAAYSSCMRSKGF